MYSFAVAAVELIPARLNGRAGTTEHRAATTTKKDGGGNRGDGFIPSRRRHHHHRRHQECILPPGDSSPLRVLIFLAPLSPSTRGSFFALIHLSTSSLRVDGAFSFACPTIARGVLRRGSQRHNIGPLHRKKLRGL